MEIKDKIIIVTGASSGIGEAAAKLLHQYGATVIIAARSEDKLKQMETALENATAIPTDMTDRDSIDNLITKTKERFGRVDILINNAGQGMNSTTEQIDIDEYKRLIDLNVIGPLIAMQKVIPIMRSQGGGMIVNISSSVSKMIIPNLGAYASTKYALNCLSLTAREELKEDNIIVSLVHPYRTATEFFKNAVKVGETRFAARPNMPEADPPEAVAEKILDVIKTEAAEQYIHGWQTDMQRGS